MDSTDRVAPSETNEETSELFKQNEAHWKQLQGVPTESPSFSQKDPEVHQEPGT